MKASVKTHKDTLGICKKALKGLSDCEKLWSDEPQYQVSCLEETRRTHTHTHTYLHSWFTGMRNGFYTVTNCIFYCPTPNRKLLAIFEFHKTPFCMFFKPFVLQGHRKCPHKPCLRCSTHVIIHICVLVNHIYQYTHTHTHTHTHTNKQFEAFHFLNVLCIYVQLKSKVYIPLLESAQC